MARQNEKLYDVFIRGVRATDRDEAAMIVERALAGKADTGGISADLAPEQGTDERCNDCGRPIDWIEGKWEHTEDPERGCFLIAPREVDVRPAQVGDILTPVDEEWTCACGNNHSSEGFHACDAQGELREPDKGWEGHYRCDRCKAVILDEDGTGTVVAVAS